MRIIKMFLIIGRMRKKRIISVFIFDICCKRECTMFLYKKIIVRQISEC